MLIKDKKYTSCAGNLMSKKKDLKIKLRISILDNLSID